MMIKMDQEMPQIHLISGPWTLDPRHDLPLPHEALEGCFAMSLYGPSES